MGRICIPSAQNCEIQFFSMADEVQNMFNSILGFALGISPGIWALVILTTVVMMMLYIFYAIRTTVTMK